MMRKIKLFMSMLAAVMAFGVLVAASASATVQPLFLTESKATLSFTATGGLIIIHFRIFGLSGEIHCGKSSAQGKTQSKSMLLVSTLIELSGNCEQNGEGLGKAACTEPIRLKEVTGELGLIKLGSDTELVGLVLKPTSGTELATVTCGTSKVTFSGEVIGILPEKSKYNRLEASAELAFKANGAAQEPTEIELLFTTRTKVEITANGEQAALAGGVTLSSDGKVEIRTTGK